MSTLTYSVTLTNGSTADATDVETKFNEAKTVINGGLGNANINAAEPIAEAKVAFDNAAGHDHDGADSKEVPEVVNARGSAVDLETRLDVTQNADGTLKDAIVTGKVAVETGTAAHGATIPLPAGFIAGQCKWMVSINQLSSLGWDGDSFRTLYCSADVNRLVTCRALTWAGAYNSGTANYTIIGVK